MRRSLILYLFVFTALIAVFQYVTSRKMLESKDTEITELEEKLALADQRNDSLVTRSASDELFLFQSSEGAMTYFEDRGFKPSEISQLVEGEIIGLNKASEDNPLVPYEGMEGYMRINRIRILNHKWILAEFTDGTYWGELFITYLIDDDGNLELTTEKSVLYPY